MWVLGIDAYAAAAGSLGEAAHSRVNKLPPGCKRFQGDNAEGLNAARHNRYPGALKQLSDAHAIDCTHEFDAISCQFAKTFGLRSCTSYEQRGLWYRLTN